MKNLIRAIAYKMDTKKLEKLTKKLEKQIAKDKEYKH
jgi:hypothetical protein